MYLRRDQCTWIGRAPAKLNLYLEILGRRDDGFHELETLMAPIRLADSLRLVAVPGQSTQLGEIRLEVRECYPVGSHAVSSVERPTVPIGLENLVTRALELLRVQSGCADGAYVELVKRIPAAAGLGGGSSDAATALRLANRAWGLNWSVGRLAEVAAELGSDVPFFLESGPAICRGRGEIVERVQGLRSIHVVVVKPPVGLSAAEVYRAYDSLEPDFAGAARPGLSREMVTAIARDGNAGRWMGNRLQAAAAAMSTTIERVRAAFARLDFAAHQLSGSGSAYFGVCRNGQHARRLASILRTQKLGLVYATRSST